MQFDWLVSFTLIVAGAALLSHSLYIAGCITDEFHQEQIRRRWKMLRIFILLFILGYLSYLFSLAREHVVSNLIVAFVFFFGALFVQWVCSLTLSTVHDLNRLDVLKKESITDELTGIYNRRHLERCLEGEIARAKQLNSPLSVLMLDLDHYKKINDRYGHETGDQMLKCISSLLLQVTRRMDIVARYGGDEIVVILPNTDRTLAGVIADRIRLSVEEKSPSLGGQDCRAKGVHCTVSVGVAQLTTNEPDGKGLLQMADQALYRAKETGRNCVVAYEANTLAEALSVR